MPWERPWGGGSIVFISAWASQLLVLQCRAMRRPQSVGRAMCASSHAFLFVPSEFPILLTGRLRERAAIITDTSLSMKKEEYVAPDSLKIAMEKELCAVPSKQMVPTNEADAPNEEESQPVAW